MLLTHAPRRGSGNSCVVRVQIHETGTAAWIAQIQVSGSYRSTATATTRASSILPSTPSRRRASARRRVDGVGLSRSIPHRLHLQGARSTCCSCLDARRSMRSGSHRPRAWGAFDISLRAPELVSTGPRRTSRSPRVARGLRRATATCWWNGRMPKGPPQGPHHRRTPCGRRGTPRRVAATPRRVLSTTKCGASTEKLTLPTRPRRRRRARVRSTATAPSAGCRVRAGSSHAIAGCVR